MLFSAVQVPHPAGEPKRSYMLDCPHGRVVMDAPGDDGRRDLEILPMMVRDLKETAGMAGMLCLCEVRVRNGER